MIEEWRQHPDFPDHEISNLGRVRRYLEPFLMSNGYPHVSLGSKTKRRYLHQLVLEAFVGRRESGQVIRHLDGDKTNARLDNLRYGSYEENYADLVEHGGGNRGSRHGLAKLTDEQAGEIRRRFLDAEEVQNLADEFEVSVRLVRMIGRGERWRHLAEQQWPLAPMGERHPTTRAELLRRS